VPTFRVHVNSLALELRVERSAILPIPIPLHNAHRLLPRQLTVERPFAFTESAQFRSRFGSKTG